MQGQETFQTNDTSSETSHFIYHVLLFILMHQGTSGWNIIVGSYFNNVYQF